jgi:hypothetical protein
MAGLRARFVMDLFKGIKRAEEALLKSGDKTKEIVNRTPLATGHENRKKVQRWIKDFISRSEAPDVSPMTKSDKRLKYIMRDRARNLDKRLKLGGISDPLGKGFKRSESIDKALRNIHNN